VVSYVPYNIMRYVRVFYGTLEFFYGTLDYSTINRVDYVTFFYENHPVVLYQINFITTSVEKHNNVIND
jgi:hypothetical protein